MEQQLRVKVADLARAQGGQTALAKELGVDQATISRFVNGISPLSLDLGRALVRRFPGLRRQVTAVFCAGDMQNSNVTAAAA